MATKFKSPRTSWLLAIFAIPWLLFITLLTIAVLPFALIVATKDKRKEKRFIESMRQTGRCMEWDELKRLSAISTGTLIFDAYSESIVTRAWWSDEDLIATAPAILPDRIYDGEDSIALCNGQKLLDIEHIAQLSKYARACLDRYTDPKEGKVFDGKLPAELIDTNLSELCNVVVITKWHRDKNKSQMIAQGYPDQVYFDPEYSED